MYVGAAHLAVSLYLGRLQLHWRFAWPKGVFRLTSSSSSVRSSALKMRAARVSRFADSPGRPDGARSCAFWAAAAAACAVAAAAARFGGPASVAVLSSDASSGTSCKACQQVVCDGASHKVSNCMRRRWWPAAHGSDAHRQHAASLRPRTSLQQRQPRPGALPAAGR